MILNPLEQFKIYTIIELPRLFGYNINFTNSSLFMMISVVSVTLFLLLGVRQKSIIPGYLQAAVEYIYDFVVSIIESNTGSKGLKHIPLIFTAFIFTLSCNLVGTLPYSFTVTSHVIVTFALSIVVFVYITAVGFKESGIKFLRILLPEGTPLWLAPIMVFIKLFAYLARPISLSIRLAANMIAGHTIIKVIAGFIINMHLTLTPIPFLFIITLIGFEVFVAILQAYIFTSLTCVYLSDTVK
ncbi:F0F1 ATP synthase subunit A [Wolbachia endosymbiont of Dirofilaria (Dirofilaria) immitis]|uniref:F0F1 ATP synthase subunit A n=1 Tax=Wolbachia endosymbiont of Dirofilaria (Dirofilaria) immitis TaxID=1812115 RepID=UPI00158D3C51|nr:F0F1 ATP synthase subunit A [Wolbachia endosymbiont of Dirofilaria (Dirofilaria) immitis]QKX02116.1 F0F1 ATP synthase subunit A [Wolbachia endosymbiont of Dirofilaria (Dirofilaria) immitis]